MKDNFRVGTDAFIVKNNKLLILKRKNNNVHRPGQWDLPGGRLEIGEDPYSGVQRETKEETNLSITVSFPLAINHFTRDDGQTITLIIFVCIPTSDNVTLSDEHEAYQWIDLTLPNPTLPDWIPPLINTYLKHKQCYA